MEEVNDLSWLKTLTSQLPAPVKSRKTIFDIAGFPRWETVNSNTLAFYLDESEEHGFERLFFNSLVQLLDERDAIPAEVKELLQTDYIVERETYADSKRIDIVIKSNEGPKDKKLWAIIIENKLFAGVYNDLETYWNNVQTENKIGVVISLFDNRAELLQLEHSKKIKFHNILHTELIQKVSSQLSHYYLTSDDRHLLILKDYFQNIANMAQPLNEQLLQKQWTLYRQYAEDIENLKSIENSLKDFAVRAFFSSMQNFDFYPATNYTNVKGKHFLEKEENFETANLKHPRYFRFYIWWEDLIAYSSVSIYFELFGDYTKYGPLIKEKLRKEYTPPAPFQIGLNGGVDYDYYHLLVCDHYSFNEQNKALQDQITSMLKNVFFNPQFNVVEKCTEWIEAEIKRKND